MQTLRLIPLDDTVVFPNMGLTLTVEVGEDERIVLVPRHGTNSSRWAPWPTSSSTCASRAAAGPERLRRAPRPHRRGPTGPDGVLRVEVDERPDPVPVDGQTRSLEREYRAVVEEILELRGADARIAAFLRAIVEPGALADRPATRPTSLRAKVELLRTVDVTERLALAVRLQRERLAELQVRKRIREDVQDGADKQQREYFLRKQMESIRKELGEDEGSLAEEYRSKIDEADMPDEVREQAIKELGRLERMGDQSGESSMIRTYLDWLIAVPWGKRSEERLDPVSRVRCSTPTTPGSKMSRTGSPSTSPCASCAPIGASRPTQNRARSSRSSGPRAPARRRSASRSPGRRGVSSFACRSAGCATRRRSAAIGARTSANCRAGSCVRCVTRAR